jgi:hypothetical protein
MKTALIVLTIGFVSLAVIIICVLAIVTSTNKGAGLFEGGRGDETDKIEPPENTGG